MAESTKYHKLELKAFPLQDGYICSLNADDIENGSKKKMPQTVVILDRSNSMVHEVARITNEVLPILFNKLEYNPDDIIHLITFDSKCELFTVLVKRFKTLQINCRGTTNMTPAVHKFKELFTSFFDLEIPIRVLTISDGDVNNPLDTKEAGDKLLKFVSKFQVPINSQAMRLFISSVSQPDTTALCSMLQINNITSSHLLDVSAKLTSEEIAMKLVKLFDSDGLSNGHKMTAEIPVFLNLPWEGIGCDHLLIRSGKNVFWMNNEVPKLVQIDGMPVTVTVNSTLTNATFYDLLSHKIDFIVNNVKILKVLGTVEASQKVNRILEYFNKAEDSFFIETNVTNLKIRVQKIIASHRKTFSLLLATIANDNKISKLNSEQKAAYLRQVDSPQTSRGLARRAEKEGLNFDQIARKEVLEIAKHFDEIKDLDDSNHAISFFSQDTTFGGIKALVELSTDKNFEAFHVHEILEILNVVGIACRGPIGDYPDASRWHVDELFLGCNISLSDVLVAYKQSDGMSLMAPATNKKITNVIPIFDDPKIGTFLKKYATSLLEYTSSIGMRRIIADVPMTTVHTMGAGIWKMIFKLNNIKSTLHWEVFKKIVSTFDNFVGKYFDYINLLLHKQACEKKIFYLGNNGILNMISPLIRIYQGNDLRTIHLVPAILRSLYSFEMWRGIRRLYKKKENSEEIARLILYKLLGIDISKHVVSVTPLFGEEPSNIQFYDKPNIDYEYLSQLFQPLCYINYITLMPKYFEALNADSEFVNNIPSLSTNYVRQVLEIEYLYKDFILFNVFQAARYTTRASRESTDTETSKIVDLKDYNGAMKDINDYIREQFKDRYLKELHCKRKSLVDAMGDRVASQILSAKYYDEMISVWRYGLVSNDVNYKIARPSNPGFKTLCNELFLISKIVPQRISIVKVLLLGVDENNKPVWNNGGVYFAPNIEDLKKNFLRFGTSTEWDEIMFKFKRTGKHVYRKDKPNRHGHGNLKPSFWAMGYNSLAEFNNIVPPEEFKDYCRNHSKCCNVRNLDKDYLLSLSNT